MNPEDGAHLSRAGLSGDGQLNGSSLQEGLLPPETREPDPQLQQESAETSATSHRVEHSLRDKELTAPMVEDVLWKEEGAFPAERTREVATPPQQPPACMAVATESGWEVHRAKTGWTPLAPALHPALDAAMNSSAESVQLLIDTASRSWVPNPNLLDEEARRRCTVYVAYPQESKMGKLGGEPPRPIRRTQAGTTAPQELDSPLESKSMEERDPLMFTAQPVNGFVIQSAIFERLQEGVSERYAGHRYAGEAQVCVESAC